MQARAQYQSSAKARVLQAQTLDAERKKLELGGSTVYTVIADQQALEAAQFSEVQAEAAYANAQVEMDRTLDRSWNTTISRWRKPSAAWRRGRPGHFRDSHRVILEHKVDTPAPILHTLQRQFIAVFGTEH